MRSAAVALPILAWLVACGGTVRAESYTFHFSGAVASVFDGIGVLGPNPGALTTFAGSYTFDAATPPIGGTPVEIGESIYLFAGPPNGVAVQVGGFEFRTNAEDTDFRMIVRNAYGFSGSDDYGFVSFRNQATGLFGSAALDYLEIRWLASTREHDPLASTSLPKTPPSLSALGGGEFFIVGECFACDGPDPRFEIAGSLSTLTTSPTGNAGDLNGDGRVDDGDLAMLVGEFGGAPAGDESGRWTADLDGDGRVGLADLVLLRSEMLIDGARTIDNSAVLRGGARNAVPEPSAWLVMVSAVAGTFVARVASLRARVRRVRTFYAR